MGGVAAGEHGVGRQSAMVAACMLRCGPRMHAAAGSVGAAIRCRSMRARALCAPAMYQLGRDVLLLAWHSSCTASWMGIDVRSSRG